MNNIWYYKKHENIRSNRRFDKLEQQMLHLNTYKTANIKNITMQHDKAMNNLYDELMQTVVDLEYKYQKQLDIKDTEINELK